VEEIWGDVVADNPAMTPFVEGLGFEIREGREPDLRTIVLKL